MADASALLADGRAEAHKAWTRRPPPGATWATGAAPAHESPLSSADFADGCEPLSSSAAIRSWVWAGISCSRSGSQVAAGARDAQELTPEAALHITRGLDAAAGDSDEGAAGLLGPTGAVPAQACGEAADAGQALRHVWEPAAGGATWAGPESLVHRNGDRASDALAACPSASVQPQPAPQQQPLVGTFFDAIASVIEAGPLWPEQVIREHADSELPGAAIEEMLQAFKGSADQRRLVADAVLGGGNYAKLCDAAGEQGLFWCAHAPLQLCAHHLHPPRLHAFVCMQSDACAASHLSDPAPLSTGFANATAPSHYCLSSSHSM